MMVRYVLPVIVAAFALPALAHASDAEGISVRGRDHQVGWMHSVGPDAQGHYAMRIDVSDLDARTPTGRAAIDYRIAIASENLCEMSATAPSTPGFYDAGARQCRAAARAEAASQLAGAPATLRTVAIR